MLDCLIIGSGHSGVTCAGLLAQRGWNYALVDSGGRIGDVWRRRPPGLQLFTSRRFCRVLDEPMPGDQDGYPTVGEFGDYLEQVAGHYGIAPLFGMQVIRLARTPDGSFDVHFADGTRMNAATVIDATGANGNAYVPAFAADLDPSVRQVTCDAFRSHDDFAPRQAVAVIGDGASGRQVAAEMAAAGHIVSLARGRARKLAPQRVLGKDIFYWLVKSRLLFAEKRSALGRAIRTRDPIPVAHLSDGRLAGKGIRVTPRAVAAQGNALFFADGSRMRYDAVIWCCGYEPVLDWIHLPAIRFPGDLLLGGGVTAEPGFYVVGRKWLTCRASELIVGAARDAKHVVDHLCRWRASVD
jgi:putative flavoprotein involved in K+ transport